jgi:pseudouridine-5'-phosphate glycosidase
LRPAAVGHQETDAPYWAEFKLREIYLSIISLAACTAYSISSCLDLKETIEFIEKSIIFLISYGKETFPLFSI